MFMQLLPSFFLLFELSVAHPLHGSMNLGQRAVTNKSKAGLPWPNGPWTDINQYRSTGKVSWYYTWGPTSFNTDLEFVPMLWGENQVTQWSSSINQTIQDRKPVAALAFNEPQQSGQSNLTPQQGASLWKTYLEPLKAQGLRLGSPAPSSAPSGKTWISDFLTACASGCTVDFIALHWYDINSTAFMLYLQDFHAAFQRPIWVTEWACQNFNNVNLQCSQQDVIDFMNATQSFMDNTEWVERYAWFGAMKDMQGVNQYNRIMSSTGSINELGLQYIGAITPNISSDYQPGVVHGGSGSQGGSSTSSTSSVLLVSYWFALTAVLCTTISLI